MLFAKGLHTKHSGFVYIHMRKTGGTWAMDAIKLIQRTEFLNEHPLGRVLAWIVKRFPKSRKYVEELIASQLSCIQYNYDKRLPPEVSAEYPRLSRTTLKWPVTLLIMLLRLISTYRPVRQLPPHTRYTQMYRKIEQTPIVGGIRDPFSWHGSMFLFNFATKDKTSTQNDYPLELIRECKDFNDYLKHGMHKWQDTIYQTYLKHIVTHKGTDGWVDDRTNIHNYKPEDASHPPAQHYGFMTFYFVLTYFDRPWDILTLSPKEFEEYWTSGRYHGAMAEAAFLEQDDLKVRLKHKLKQLGGYSSQAIAELEQMPKLVNASSNNKKSLQELYPSRDSVEKVYRLEKPIFVMFPQYLRIYRDLLKTAK